MVVRRLEELLVSWRVRVVPGNLDLLVRGVGLLGGTREKLHLQALRSGFRKSLTLKTGTAAVPKGKVGMRLPGAVGTADRIEQCLCSVRP